MTATNPNIGAAYFASPDVNTNYNAMIARLQGRLMKQLTFDMNYRYSKSLDTTSFEAPTAQTNQSFPVDQREEHGPSDFDVGHNITASGMWDLPIFRNRAAGRKAAWRLADERDRDATTPDSRGRRNCSVAFWAIRPINRFLRPAADRLFRRSTACQLRTRTFFSLAVFSREAEMIISILRYLQRRKSVRESAWDRT